MEKIVIDGPVRLNGTVRISGAKNAALPILFASILCPSSCEIMDVPDVWDVRTASKLLQIFGASIERKGNIMHIDPSGLHSFKAPYELVKTMRASVLALGPLLARFGQAKVSLPGGCAIGIRPVDQHIKALQRLGAEIKIKHGYISAKLPSGRFRGARIAFDMPTVGGTEQAMTAAVLAKGSTLLENCAREPEIVDLAEFLTAMGAKIYGAGTDVIEIEGVDTLYPCAYKVIPDRIEAGTYMVAAAMTRGDITITNIEPSHLEAVFNKLTDAGVQIETISHDTIHVWANSRIQAVDISTAAYPGFPTDMQAQFMALMSIANGSSVIKENIFENRFMHAQELLRMGADIRVEGNTAFVRGVESLTAADVMATDLRASASLVLAGLVADGKTHVRRVYHLWRGYENLVEKFRALGANIVVEQDETL